MISNAFLSSKILWMKTACSCLKVDLLDPQALSARQARLRAQVVFLREGGHAARRNAQMWAHRWRNLSRASQGLGEEVHLMRIQIVQLNFQLAAERQRNAAAWDQIGRLQATVDALSLAMQIPL